MSEWKKVVDTASKAACLGTWDDQPEAMHNAARRSMCAALRALIAAGYAIVPRRAIPGRIRVDELIKIPTHEGEYEYYVTAMEVKPDD